MEAIKDRLEHKKQIMLFINKRGYNSFVSCRSCGEALKCPHCDVALKKHKDDSLRCHYCGYSQPVPKKCPSCGSSLIGGYGTGTEKVEAEIKKLFPEAVTLRMDSDTTKGKSDYIDILESFARHEADILIGTQMIVKGHDFPEVTLVGIMLADLTLFNNDYRAGERTFALLTQASGRAGRGVNPGKVIIQTYQPDNYVAFYKMEMSYRRLMKYPPAWDMMVMLIVSENRELLEKGCNILRSRLKAVNSLSNMKIIGPVEPVISKINDKYRRVVYFKSSAHSQLVELMNQIEDFMENDESCRELMIQFDFNPVKMY
jgi:primosomal protein N' (replication factor Y)